MDSFLETIRGEKFIVSLTFDDALDVHLDTAIPLLDRYGLKGSFFVNIAADCFLRRHEEWRSAAENGHELGNHTIFHPAVTAKSWVTEGIALDTYTLDRMRRELVVANGILHMLDGKQERTFAFPCSNPWIGRPGYVRRILTALHLERTRLMGWADRIGLSIGSRLQDYTEIVRPLFVAARCGSLPAGELLPIPKDRYRIRGVEGDGMVDEALLTCVDTCIRTHAWLIFVFHGIDGGHRLSCDREAFEELLTRLSTDSRIQVMTFLSGARRLWPA